MVFGYAPERYEHVRKTGITALPNKNKSGRGFRDLPVVHGTGRAGDVFFLNHMTAHFVAPNTSPDIREAVYFRLSSDDFRQGDSEPMLNPLRDWIV